MNTFSDNRVLERPLVKICGTTSIEDAQMALEAGADFLGVIVEHPASPRHLSRENAAPIFRANLLPTIAVTVNKTLDELLFINAQLRPYALQLHGDETAELVRKLVQRDITVWAACSGEREIVRQRALQMTEAGADSGFARFAPCS